MHLIISGILQLIIVLLLMKSINKLRERVDELESELNDQQYIVQLAKDEISVINTHIKYMNK